MESESPNSFELLNFLRSSKDPLKPFDFLDVLPYYSAVSSYLFSFLKGKELASRIWIPGGPMIIKRGSKLPQFFVSEIASLAESWEGFFRLRAHHLGEVKHRLNDVQRKAWEYFPPRKLADYFYATNGEGKDRPIERIFIDIDRGKGITTEQARRVTQALLVAIKEDENFRGLVGDFTTFVMWTGSSFHIYIFPKKRLNHSFYEKYLSYSRTTPSLFNILNRLIARVRKETDVPIIGGHEKGEGRIVIDPSQTPGGKLARCPFSLHMKDAKTVDGVALPLSESMLAEEGITNYLQQQTVKDVLERLEEWISNLPQFERE